MQRVKISSHSPVQKLGDAQFSSSPRFKLASSSSSPSIESQPLIPGLPDDVAVLCILRLPLSSLPDCASVNRRWRRTVGTKGRFFTERKLRGVNGTWLFVLAFDTRFRKVRSHVLDLAHRTWHAVPAVPGGDRISPHGVRCVAVGDGAVVVCGGAVLGSDRPLDVVLGFDLQRDRWTAMTRLLTPRSFFAAGLIGGTVYAAGGRVADLAELNSAESLDLCHGEWRTVASMPFGLEAYDSAVLDEKLVVTEGWTWPFVFSPRGLSYDPTADAWNSLPPGLCEGWTGPSAVLDGHLFVICEHENLQLKVYDAESDGWETVDGSPAPAKISKPFSVGAGDGQIYVVGRDLHAAIGQLCRTDRRKASFSVRWLVVDAPEFLRGSTPSSALVLHG